MCLHYGEIVCDNIGRMRKVECWRYRNKNKEAQRDTRKKGLPEDSRPG